MPQGSLHQGDRTQIGWAFQGTPPRRSTQEKWHACGATLQQPRPLIKRRPCRSAEIGASKKGCPPTRGDEKIFQFQTLAPRGIIVIWSLETRERIFSLVQTVSKRHKHAIIYLVILCGSLNILKNAVMLKRRSFYTAIFSVFHAVLWLQFSRLFPFGY